MLYSLTERFHHSQEPAEEGAEDRGSRFLPNFVTFLPDYIISNPRR
jgi:hypothetical protein